MNPLARALLGGLLSSVAAVLIGLLVGTWHRAKWRKHEPPGFLIGWLHADGFFILHLGPGYLEWGSLFDSIQKLELPPKQIEYLRPRWMR